MKFSELPYFINRHIDSRCMNHVEYSRNEFPDPVFDRSETRIPDERGASDLACVTCALLENKSFTNCGKDCERLSTEFESGRSSNEISQRVTSRDITFPNLFYRIVKIICRICIKIVAKKSLRFNHEAVKSFICIFYRNVIIVVNFVKLHVSLRLKKKKKIPRLEENHPGYVDDYSWPLES